MSGAVLLLTSQFPNVSQSERFPALSCANRKKRFTPAKLGLNFNEIVTIKSVPSILADDRRTASAH